MWANLSEAVGNIRLVGTCGIHYEVAGLQLETAPISYRVHNNQSINLTLAASASSAQPMMGSRTCTRQSMDTLYSQSVWLPVYHYWHELWLVFSRLSVLFQREVIWTALQSICIYSSRSTYILLVCLFLAINEHSKTAI